jgi:DNA polymerase-3 subunit alpha
MFSCIQFYKACLENEIKPIIGIEMYECENINFDDNSRYHLIVLAKNNNGLKALNELSTISYSKGYYYKPRISVQELKDYADDLIICSACMAGRLSKCFLEYYPDKTVEIVLDKDRYWMAKDYILQYKKLFPHFYIELQSHNVQIQVELNRILLDLAKETNTPYIITTDSHMVKKEDLDIHSIFVQIGEEREVGETYQGCYLQTEEEIHKIMDEQIGKKNVDIGLKYTNEISDMCKISYNLNAPNQMPIIDIPNEYESIDDYYKDLLGQGWIKRELYKLSKEQQKIYNDRIEYEYDVLKHLGYIDYFIM